MLRGYFHGGAVPLAVAGTVALALLSRADPLKAWTMGVYGLSMVILLAMSATYHSFNWRPRVRAVLRQIDHADIFLFIAGTYTAIGVNAFTGWWRIGLVASIWVLSVVGMAAVSPSLRLPRWGLALMYLGIGSVGVVALPEVVRSLGWGAFGLILTGGAFYSAGAATYALRWPRLWPRVFGYHEVFHLLVLAASAAYFLLMLLYVVPHHRV